MTPTAIPGDAVGVRIQLLGGFHVAIDGVPVPDDRWRQRARHLVALASLTPTRRLHRERVASTLWPHLERDAALANLHKAAHHVRRATGDRRAVVLAGGMVELWPDRDVVVDALAFEARAREALDGHDPAHRRHVADEHASGLLVEDPYEEWTQEPRTRLRVLRDRLVSRPPPHAGASSSSTHGADLVGRATEVGRLAAAMDRAAAGHPTIAVLRGRAGIGKSALLAELARRATTAGWAVWHGRAHAGADPYTPLRDALADLRTDGPEVLGRLSEQDRQVLDRVVAARSTDPGHRHAVLGALRQAAFLQAETRSGLLIALDDADDLDDATTEVLRSLGRATTGRLLLCVATRTIEASAPPGQLAAQAARDGGDVIAVGPLDQEAATRLARRATRGRLAGDAATRVARQAEGVPLLVLAAARLRDEGDRADTADVLARLAAGLAGGNAERLADLELFAVSGTVPIAALPTLVESSTRADRLVATGALERTGTRYGWRTRLLRDAVLAGIPAHRRPRLHAVVADRLVTAGAPDSEIARHLLASGRGAEAVPHLTRAADAAAGMAAWADALALVETALDHAPGDTRLVGRRARLQFLTGDPAAATTFAQAAQAATGDSVRDLRLGQAWALLTIGDVDGARHALAELPATPAPTSAREATVRGMVACFAGRLDEGDALAAAALDLARSSGRPDAVIDAAFVSGMVAHSRGEVPAHLRRELLAAEGLPRLAGAVHDGYLCPAQSWLYSGEPLDRVASFAADLQEAAREVGAVRGEAFAALLHGQALQMTGQHDAAASTLSDALELHQSVGAAAGETLALVLLALLTGSTDRAGHAGPLLAAADDISRHSPLTAWHLLPRIHGARVVTAPDLATALARVEDAMVALSGPEDRCPACWLALALPGAVVSARAGRHARASELATRAEAIIAARWRRGGWVAGLHEARAWISHGHEPELAVARLEAAADEFERCGQHPDTDRCRSLLAAWS